MKRLRQALLLAVAGLLVLCLGTTAASALVNRGLPSHSTVPGRLTEADQARLAEAVHLQQALGDEVWPGWGAADIPLILYNESNAFLAGLPSPAAGWVKVPATAVLGGAWEPVPGEAYYRQPVEDAAARIGAFTVVVGERWVAAFSTEEWSRASFYQGLREDLPPALRTFFPYTIAWRLLMGAGDRYQTALLHESFHAYQGMLQPERLMAAERAASLERRYPWDEAEGQAAWREELSLLGRAVQAAAPDQQRALAQQFLQQRQERRAAMGLAPQLVDYERQREWLEGLAKYAELSIGLAAATAPGYQPLPEALAAVPGFEGYGAYRGFYQAQLGEVARMGGRPGEVRFYYGGMAQAVLLDRLNPAWKPLAMQGACLEDLLAEALEMP